MFILFLIAADAIQCLRSSLDHAVWSLASLKFPDPDWTEFPIFSVRPETPKQCEQFNKRLRGLNDEAIEYIKTLQPYNRPEGLPLTSDFLYQLHEINRIDKHRRILVRTVMSVPFTSGFGVTVPGKDSIFDPKRTDYGYEVRRFGKYKSVKPSVALRVVFGEGKSGITVALSDLWDIYEFVSNTVLPTLAGLAQQSN